MIVHAENLASLSADAAAAPEVYKVVSHLRERGTVILAPLGGGSILHQRADSVVPHPCPFSRLRDWKQGDSRQVALRLQALQLASGLRLGQEIRVFPLPHQLLAVQRFLDGYHHSRKLRRFLLADEPGMGKTIEACLIHSLLSRQDEARRVLFLVPPRVADQWGRTLVLRFGERLTRVVRTGRDLRDMTRLRKAVISYDLAKLGDFPARIGSVPWDVIVIDEAHNLTPDTDRLELAQALLRPVEGAPPVILFLTATPFSGNPRQLDMLLRLLDEGKDGEKEGTPVETLEDRVLRLRDRIICQTRSKAINHDGGKLFPSIEVRDPVDVFATQHGEVDAVAEPVFTELEEAVSAYLKSFKHAGFLQSTYLRMLGSSFAALAEGLKRRLEPLTEKNDGPPAEDSGSPESLLDGEQTEECLSRARRLRAGEAEVLQGLLSRFTRLRGRDPKLAALLRIVRTESRKDRKPGGKFLIFTEFRATQAFLAEFLERDFGCSSVALIRGGMSAGESLGQIERFTNEAGCRFLISTDAGSEGIDLQASSVLINYDLPWNPMRLEQRIGRIYRYGAASDVIVYNLIQSRRDRVYRRLSEKIDQLAKVLPRMAGDYPGESESGSGRDRCHARFEIDLRRQLIGVVAQDMELMKLYEEPPEEEEAADRLENILKSAAAAWRQINEVLSLLPPPDSDALRARLGEAGIDRVRAFLENSMGRRLRKKQWMGENKREHGLQFRLPAGARIPRGSSEVDKDGWVKAVYSSNIRQAFAFEELRLLAPGDPLVDAVVFHHLRPDQGGEVGFLELAGPTGMDFRGLAVFFLAHWRVGNDGPCRRRLVPVALNTSREHDSAASRFLEGPLDPLLPVKGDFRFVDAMTADPARLRDCAREALHDRIAKLEIDRGTSIEVRTAATVFVRVLPRRKKSP